MVFRKELRYPFIAAWEGNDGEAKKKAIEGTPIYRRSQRREAENAYPQHTQDFQLAEGLCLDR